MNCYISVMYIVYHDPLLISCINPVSPSLHPKCDPMIHGVGHELLLVGVVFGAIGIIALEAFFFVRLGALRELSYHYY